MSTRQQLRIMEWVQWLSCLGSATLVLLIGMLFRQTALGLVAGTLLAWFVIHELQFEVVTPLEETAWEEYGREAWLNGKLEEQERLNATSEIADAAKPTSSEKRALPADFGETRAHDLLLPIKRAAERKAEESARLREEMGGYDPGMAENVFFLFFGWLFPLLWLSAVLLARSLWHSWRKVRNFKSLA